MTRIKTQGQKIEDLIVKHWIKKCPSRIRAATKNEQKILGLDLIIVNDKNDTINNYPKDFTVIFGTKPNIKDFKTIQNKYSSLLFIDIKSQISALYNINIELYNYDENGNKRAKWWYTSLANQYWWVLNSHKPTKDMIGDVIIINKDEIQDNVNWFANRFYNYPITDEQIAHLDSLPANMLDIKQNSILAQQASAEYNQSDKLNRYDTLLYNIQSLPILGRFNIDLSSILKQS